MKPWQKRWERSRARLSGWFSYCLPCLFQQWWLVEFQVSCISSLRWLLPLLPYWAVSIRWHWLLRFAHCFLKRVNLLTSLYTKVSIRLMTRHKGYMTKLSNGCFNVREWLSLLMALWLLLLYCFLCIGRQLLSRTRMTDILLLLFNFRLPPALSVRKQWEKR